MPVNLDTAKLFSSGQFSDLIIKSNDNHQISVHRIIVCTASPSLIDRATSSSAKQIRVDEPGWVLESLLERVYKVTETPLHGGMSVESILTSKEPNTLLKELICLTTVALAAENLGFEEIQEECTQIFLALLTHLKDIKDKYKLLNGFISKDSLTNKFVHEIIKSMKESGMEDDDGEELENKNCDESMDDGDDDDDDEDDDDDDEEQPKNKNSE